ncbi:MULTISPECIES: hypothetical protein [Bacillus]|uniref:hypothetical protein n=1 Tax=Bacillus TaxID=1386 RepID=UPI000BB8884B|nr:MULTISPECIES: hypothetical protein [Bacillus]
MKDQLNFGEFYPKSLVPIKENDLLLFFEKLSDDETVEKCSHWLIALEGNEMAKGENYYHWQVVVYPAELGGTFNYKYPFYVSNFFTHIDEAIDFICEVETIANNGELFTIAG